MPGEEEGEADREIDAIAVVVSVVELGGDEFDWAEFDGDEAGSFSVGVRVTSGSSTSIL